MSIKLFCLSASLSILVAGASAQSTELQRDNTAVAALSSMPSGSAGNESHRITIIPSIPSPLRRDGQGIAAPSHKRPALLRGLPSRSRVSLASNSQTLWPSPAGQRVGSGR
ncbi:MAG TPA: hypothetical protein VM865_07765 [Acidobacteriaceae bacterium]|nr:hypothetical protein [Acidobacteriaceae bacterium]